MSRYRSYGFSIVEFIIAASLFLMISVVGVTTITQSGKLDKKGNTQEKALRYSQEGLEAVRSIRNQSFSSLVSGTYGLSSSGGTWALSGGQNVNDGMTRTVILSDVYRDTSGTIVTSGGTIDPDTKKAVVTVSWVSEQGKPRTITEESYLTNFKKSLGCYAWGSPVQESSLNIPVANEGWRVKTQGNFAYVTFGSGGNDFSIIDISNPASPYVRSTLNLNSSNQNNIAIGGNYVYLASTSTAHEVKIIDVSDPDDPQIIETFNLQGNANANGIFLLGSYLYVTRDGSSDKELYVLDVSDPTDIDVVGTYEAGFTLSDIYINGNYAYVTSSSDTQEFLVLNVSDPSAISKIASYNIANSTADAISMTVYNNRVYIGLQTGGIYILDVAVPSSPQLVGVYSTTASINDILFLSDPSCLFLATDTTFTVVDVSNPASPSLIGSYVAGAVVNGVAYDADMQRVFLMSQLSTGEFTIIRSQ